MEIGISVTVPLKLIAGHKRRVQRIAVDSGNPNQSSKPGYLDLLMLQRELKGWLKLSLTRFALRNVNRGG